MKIENGIADLLGERGMAENELANLCSMDQGHLNRIKNGRVHPNIFTALRIAKVLEANVSDLFRIVDERRNGADSETQA